MTRRQAVVIEYHDGDWLVLFDSGTVQAFGSPAAALTAVQRAARRGNHTATVTTVEWRNVPVGFVPPAGT